jgi:hypothetical protein
MLRAPVSLVVQFIVKVVKAVNLVVNYSLEQELSILQGTKVLGVKHSESFYLVNE